MVAYTCILLHICKVYMYQFYCVLFNSIRNYAFELTSVIKRHEKLILRIPQFVRNCMYHLVVLPV